jgi:hypothetical protein
MLLNFDELIYLNSHIFLQEDATTQHSLTHGVAAAVDQAPL